MVMKKTFSGDAAGMFITLGKASLRGALGAATESFTGLIAPDSAHAAVNVQNVINHLRRR